MSNRRQISAVHRRRRTVAGTFVLVVIVLAVFGIGSAIGGGGAERDWYAVEIPSDAANDWAQSTALRRQALADQQALDRVMATTSVLRHGEGNRPLIALTFDDGPGEFTPQVLDILDSYGVQGTFFVIGGANDRAGATIKDILGRGHVVANHTVTHPDLTSLNARGQAAEIDAQTEAIELFAGFTPRLFRPPYNAWNDQTVELLQRRDMLMVLWSIETNDWARPGADAIVQSTLQGAHPGGIVLLHDGGGDRTQTVAALPRIIEGLQGAGYELVTVPRLLQEDPPVSDQRNFGS